ncbi:MAG: ABC transporter substrate-binding protein [Lentisphaerae bacterium]|nr:ABC transporter substrate-binding protein [Lentisphaerota bacterium]
MKKKYTQIVVLAVFVVISLFLVRMIEKHQKSSPAAESTVPDISPRIVSLVPSITETLFMLGLGDHVVARSDYCDFPPEATSLTAVGSLSGVNVEAIARLKPDWVILSDSQAQSKLHTALANLRINHLGVPSNSLEEIMRGIWELGEKFDRQENATIWLEQLDKIIEAAISAAPETKPRVLVCAGRDPGDLRRIYVSGKGNFYEDLIKIGGGVNAYDGTLPYPMVSIEGIIQMNPDIIIDVITGPSVDTTVVGDALYQWSRLTTVNAVANANVHIITDSWAARPGPRIGLIIEAFSNYIQKWGEMQ